MTLEEYLNLVTSEHRDKPVFIATLTANLNAPLELKRVLESIGEKFDVDTAVGVQLDIVGEWVGISRNVTTPIPGVFFSWDADYTLGWEFGVWQDGSETEITVLPDDVYRTLIKAKIAANRWDGTTDGAYDIWELVFTNLTILIQDYQNMSYSLALVGGIVDSLTFALLTGGYIPLKPEGVRVVSYIVPVNDGPLFGWDLDTDYVQGWDEGSWGREQDPV